MASRWRGPSRREAHQSASIAIRWVLPVPVAAFSAMRGMPAFHSAFAARSRARIASHFAASATGPASSSQMTVSAASSWHQKGRIGMPAGGDDQWSRSCLVFRAVPLQLPSRQRATTSRSSLIVRWGSTCAAGSASSSPHRGVRSVSAASGGAVRRRPWRSEAGPGPGISIRDRLGRRPRSSVSSARPRWSSRQWLVGAS